MIKVKYSVARFLKIESQVINTWFVKRNEEMSASSLIDYFVDWTRGKINLKLEENDYMEILAHSKEAFYILATEINKVLPANRTVKEAINFILTNVDPNKSYLPDFVDWYNSLPEEYFNDDYIEKCLERNNEEKTS